MWHQALNNDLKVAPSGGEDSITNLHRTKLIGSVRTYAYTGSKFSIAAWIKALRAGRTFFSTGPLLDFKINGKMPGESLRLEAAGTVTLEGLVESIAPLDKIVIYRNGDVVKKLAGPGRFRESLEVKESSWFTLYAEGRNYRLLDGEFAQASTNAIRVYVGDGPIRNKQSAEYFVRWIDRLRAMSGAWPFWRSDGERAHVFGQFDEARRFYQNR